MRIEHPIEIAHPRPGEARVEREIAADHVGHVKSGYRKEGRAVGRGGKNERPVGPRYSN